MNPTLRMVTHATAFVLWIAFIFLTDKHGNWFAIAIQGFLAIWIGYYTTKLFLQAMDDYSVFDRGEENDKP